MEQSESISNLGEETKVVPKNLKTLCILSFIMGGLMILGSLWEIKRHYAPNENDIAQKQVETERFIKYSPHLADEIYTFEEGKGINGIVGLITQITSIVGVFLMLKLNKTGFFIYMAGELLPYVINTAVRGFSQTAAEIEIMGGPFKGVGIGVFVFMICIDLLFIFLYSKQTKYMK